MAYSGSIIIYTDGGSRGNPGPAAGAFVVLDQNNNQLCACAKFLSKATNNVAEYTGLVCALKKAVELKADSIKIFSDSQLMVKQIKGEYKVKNQGLKPLYSDCISLLKNFKKWQITHVYRDKNTLADAMVNRSIDILDDIEEDYLSTADSQKHLRLGVLLSGGGRTMDNILEKIESGFLDAEIVTVISSRSDVAGVGKARRAKLPLEIIRKKDFETTDDFSEQIRKNLLANGVDLVIQAGWLCLWKIPAEFENKVMNIHPGLLPSFGGKGMWGHHVHEAVLKAGCKVSGCTVHFCTNEYDKGPIIIQKCCKVAEDDTPQSLADRVFEAECSAYPEAIRLYSENKITVRDNRTFIDG